MEMYKMEKEYLEDTASERGGHEGHNIDFSGFRKAFDFFETKFV